MNKNKLTLLAFGGALLLLASSNALAGPITIGTGNSIGTVSNVLLNDATNVSTVTGGFNSNPGFFVNFTSTSGLLTGNGGQATLNPGTNNNPFTDICFSLASGATFTNADFNLDAIVVRGTLIPTITITTFFIGANGSPDVQTQTVTGSGQNRISVDAGMGALITKICLDAGAGVTFADLKQPRLGGFANAPVPAPDGGMTVALLGGSLAAIELLRRKLLKRAPIA